jgi:hypothetical protein
MNYHAFTTLDWHAFNEWKCILSHLRRFLATFGIHFNQSKIHLNEFQIFRSPPRLRQKSLAPICSATNWFGGATHSDRTHWRIQSPELMGGSSAKNNSNCIKCSHFSLNGQCCLLNAWIHSNSFETLKRSDMGFKSLSIRYEIGRSRKRSKCPPTPGCTSRRARCPAWLAPRLRFNTLYRPLPGTPGAHALKIWLPHSKKMALRSAAPIYVRERMICISVVVINVHSIFECNFKIWT